MNILLTGGAGYIGSHTAAALLEGGYRVVILDNLSNSSPDNIERLRSVAGKPVTFYEADIRDRHALEGIFKKERVDAVIHLAGLKSLNESVEKPLAYYDNNFVGAYTLCQVMTAHQVKRLIFSSSAAVYGGRRHRPHPGGCSAECR